MPQTSSLFSLSSINMNNAFSRQNISEEIIDFFEEHNFTFSGYAYDDNCHDKALHVGLENPATGEELISLPCGYPLVITLEMSIIALWDWKSHIETEVLI